MNDAQLTFIKKKREDILNNKLPSSFKNNRLVPFVGAGFSQNIPSYPSFCDFINKNLASRLCSDLHIETKNKLDLWNTFDGNPNEAIEYFIWRMGLGNNGNSRSIEKIYKDGKQAFYVELKNEFKKTENMQVAGCEEFWEQHFLLIKKFSMIYTTNWDIAIETACDYVLKKKIQKIKWEKKFSVRGSLQSKSDQSASPQKTIAIIKYHGDLENCDSIIASETDYYERLNRNDPLDVEFKNVLANNDILFIGYGLGDINVKYHMNQIHLLNEAFNRNHKKYWLLVDNPEEIVIEKERQKFLAEWRNLEICYLFDGESNSDQKREKIAEILGNFAQPGG